ncbi:MAG: hypothetical protein GC190_05065 [Alphaproteobacteria bacterium]|nr:hypothetical protein [Alphaproteobacteria bacterium]
MVVASLELKPDRPLVICDADEVLVQFLVGLERFLLRNNRKLVLKSFAIHGNVVDAATGETITHDEVTRLLKDFFQHDTHQLDPVPGAADALNALRAQAQIIVLSNLPETAREIRRAHLASHGMDYPVIAGSGPKGPIVRDIVQAIKAPVVFIDDLPPHLTSVAQATPHVHRLHFVADRRLARMIEPAQDAHRRIDDWPSARTWIESVIS